MRRLITLIFADRDLPAVMVVIRRELSRTRGVSPALRPVNIGAHEDPPSVCPLSRCPLCFTVKPGGLSRYAARRVGVRSLTACSTCVPTAQTNPNSSRPTAVTTFCLVLPRAKSLL